MQFTKPLRGAAALVILLVATLGVLRWAPWRPRPLWSGSRYTERDRDRAVERGLTFIGRVASNPEYFSRWGHDLLWCFYTVSATSRNEHLRAIARRAGQERARQWLHDHAELHYNDPDDLSNYVEGLHSAEMLLGRHDEALRSRIQSVAAQYSAVDFLKFDPRLEPPPADIPELCPKCNRSSHRGATRCEWDHTPLTFRNRYDVWLDALIRTHEGDRYGVTLGGSYADTVRWISVMRPYPSSAQLQADEDEFFYVTYAVTHVVYTLDDYGKYRLSSGWLRPEFDYLRMNLQEAAEMEDGEMLGEFLDTLRAFGQDESDPGIRASADYLLSHQNPDGSWGHMDDDMYTRYHSTWTAVDGLRLYAYQGERRAWPFVPAPRQASAR